MSADNRDTRLALRLVFGLSALAVLVVVLLVMAAMITLPVASPWVNETFNSGLGLKTAAVIAAVVSVAVLAVFGIVAGDGLIGEIQFMIAGFFLFFVFFWLMIAWVF